MLSPNPYFLQDGVDCNPTMEDISKGGKGVVVKVKSGITGQQSSIHPHTLTYHRQLNRGLYDCAKCSTFGVSAGWTCQQCDVQYHPQCCDQLRKD